jgi:coenzyme Q-binding protein COQ10
VGWGGYEETFTSRLFCIPGFVVEALSGEAVTELPKADVPHYSATFDSPMISNNIFKSLSTRWVVKPFHYKPPTGMPQTDMTEEPSQDRTEVHLIIDFQFANPIYAALSKAVAPKVAGVMIEAFEVRAKYLLERSGSSIKEKGSLGDAFNAEKKMDA